ncbi:MAG: sensor histidine kinase, partial [Verrucomicrobium sp.]
LSRLFRPDLVEEDHGWEWPPGGAEAVFWVHKNARLIIAFTIDAKAVQDNTGRHLTIWLQPRLGRFIERNENLRIDAPWGPVAAQTPGTASSHLPDFSAPLASRWGFWQIQSWDRISDLTRYDAPTLLVTGLVACLLGALGFTLAQSQKRSQRLAEQRVSFVNQVSHELGTPLTNMLLNLDLAREAVPLDPEGALRRLKLAEEETRRLVRLTENVLSFSRQERNDLCLSPAPCVPDEVVAEVLDHFQAALQRSGVTPECHLQAPHAVTLDRDALAQILSNLLSNVEKYASSGGWFRLETQWQDGWLHLAISDRGPGIPDSETERIFRPFERLANHTSEGVTGAGLGLSISLELARLMGGDLKLTKQTAGAEFALRVPAPSA